MTTKVPFRQFYRGGGGPTPFQQLNVTEADYRRIGDHLDLDRKQQDYDTYWTFYEDFVVNAQNVAPDGWTRMVSGLAGDVSSGYAGPDGLWQCETAAGGGAGAVSIRLGTNSGITSDPFVKELLPTIVIRFNQRVTLEASGKWWLGLGDSAFFAANSTTEPNDFIGFRRLSGAAVNAVTLDDTLETATVTSLTPTNGTFYIFKAELVKISSSAYAAKFYRDDRLVATHTENLPDTTAAMTIGFKHFGDGGGGLVDFMYGWQLREATRA